MHNHNLPEVNQHNYFSPETNMAYMSASQFKAFMKCEAAALAELRGELVRESTPALLVGSYIDAYFSNELAEFKQSHPEILMKTGGLKSDYRKAEEIIQRIERDRLFMAMLSGAKQVIRTGTIAGVPFKIKIDCLLSSADCDRIADAFPGMAAHLTYQDGAINDLKIMRDFAPVWQRGVGRVPFVEAWGYDYQLSIYRAIEGGRKPCFILGATKEDTPDIEIFEIPQLVMDVKMLDIEESAPRYADIKRGIREPDACGECAYCRQQKTLERSIDYRFYQLDGGDET